MSRDFLYCVNDRGEASVEVFTDVSMADGRYYKRAAYLLKFGFKAYNYEELRQCWYELHPVEGHNPNHIIIHPSQLPATVRVLALITH